MEELYGNVDNIDAFIGGIAEDHMDGSSVGDTVDAVVANQFERLRDGDRFFYAGDQVLQTRLVRQVIDLENVSLGGIIEQNTGVTNLQNNVFFDESVLYVEAGRHPANVTVVQIDDTVAVVDSRGNVLDSRPVDQLSQVILVGTDSYRGDRFTLDASIARLSIDDGIVIQGRVGRHDVLTIRGGEDDDSVVVDGDQLVVNGMFIEISGIERLELYLGLGEDSVDIVDEGDLEIVQSGNGAWHGHHQRDRNRSRLARRR